MSIKCFLLFLLFFLGRTDAPATAGPELGARPHYALNFNFRLAADSLRLPAPAEVDADSVTLRRGDVLVVADIVHMPSDTLDSVWVKVARDQWTMAWVHERTLLAHAVPDDPISRFIHFFARAHVPCFTTLFIMALLVAGCRWKRSGTVRMVHVEDVGSAYPSLLCVCVSALAMLYAAMQEFAPATWTDFYFHPTFNPVGLAPVLSAFVALLWLTVVLAVAAVEDVRHQLPAGEAFWYLFLLAGLCAGLHLFFSHVPVLAVGLPGLAGYTVFSLVRYWRHARPRYVCGHCGTPLRRRGRCPYCGTLNE